MEVSPGRKSDSTTCDISYADMVSGRVRKQPRKYVQGNNDPPSKWDQSFPSQGTGNGTPEKCGKKKDIIRARAGKDSQAEKKQTRQLPIIPDLEAISIEKSATKNTVKLYFPAPRNHQCVDPCTRTFSRLYQKRKPKSRSSV